jgi:hypothetical protein
MVLELSECMHMYQTYEDVAMMLVLPFLNCYMLISSRSLCHRTRNKFRLFFNDLSDSARINPRVWNHSANAMDKMVSPKLSHSYVLE